MYDPVPKRKSAHRWAPKGHYQKAGGTKHRHQWETGWVPPRFGQPVRETGQSARFRAAPKHIQTVIATRGPAI
jgi:hypothetical protein